MYEFGIKVFKNIGLSVLLVLASQPATAIQEGWYLGAGYGATHLSPKVPFDIFIVAEKQSELSKVIVGYDVDQLASVEVSVSDLGEALLTNDDTVAYAAANIAGLYRLYDSQNQPYSNQTWGVNLFAKLGLGYLKLDSDTALDSESRVNMLVGVGVEFATIAGLSVRTEFEFIDTDALTAGVSLLKRFRFTSKQANNIFDNNRPPLNSEEQARPEAQNQPNVVPAAPVPISDPIVEKPLILAPAPVPRVEVNKDIDGDGVTDTVDKCLDSKPGYPVRADGCGMLNGVLSNLKFAQYSSELTEQTKAGLRGLAKLLNKYPNAVVRMGAHTAIDASPASQLALTRDRIRAIGIYLRELGVSSKRIKYMAFGAKVPFKGRATDRIDIKELN